MELRKARPLIILTAFHQFGEYPANPTEIIASDLGGSLDVYLFSGHKFSAFAFHSIVFDTKIPRRGDRGRTVLRCAKTLGAVGIISLGMSSSKTGLCVEAVATNRIYNKKYCPASINNRPIRKDRPYKEKLSLNLASWHISAFLGGCLRENIPSMFVSENAGSFCCNHLMYQVRMAQLASVSRPEIPFIFLHTPCSPEAISNRELFLNSGKTVMTIAEMKRGLGILLENSFISR